MPEGFLKAVGKVNVKWEAFTAVSSKLVVSIHSKLLPYPILLLSSVDFSVDFSNWLIWEE